MKLIGTCIAIAAMTPLLANALPPGQYEVGGVQQICLVDDGTWYGTTFANWGGTYVVKGSKTFLIGNYRSGRGNDAMDFYEDGHGPWSEWRDNLSYQNISPSKITFTKEACDPPAAAALGGDRNPQEGR